MPLHRFLTHLRLLLLLGSLLLGVPCGLPANGAEKVDAFSAAFLSITADEARDHVEALANDTFEGREAGSRGGHAAGRYVTDRLARAKLQPGGDSKGYFQLFGNQHRNILCLLPGTDETLRDEIVLIGAHYDHVGYGNARNSYGPWGYIHNGADDNASGTAALLEVIDAFSRLPQPSKRTVMFAFWDAEEKGLLGSQHWVDHPTVPLKQLHMTLNMDMVGRLRDDRVEVYGVRTSPGLRYFVSQQNADTGLRLVYSWEMKALSDHYTFYQKRLPTVFLHTGLHSDYHRPSDDAEKLSYPGIERVARLAFALTHAFANETEDRPFRDASRQESPSTQQVMESAGAPPPVRLGIDWETDEGTKAVTVTKVRRRSPAEAADLRSGDRITHFNGAPLANPADFAELVMIADRDIVLTVVRQGEPQPVEKTVPLQGGPSRWGITWREDEAEPNGVIVIRVLGGSPADKAGVSPGDRIHRINGQELHRGVNLLPLLIEAPTQIEILVEREGIEKRLTLTSLKPGSGR